MTFGIGGRDDRTFWSRAGVAWRCSRVRGRPPRGRPGRMAVNGVAQKAYIVSPPAPCRAYAARQSKAWFRSVKAKITAARQVNATEEPCLRRTVCPTLRVVTSPKSWRLR